MKLRPFLCLFLLALFLSLPVQAQSLTPPGASTFEWLLGNSPFMAKLTSLQYNFNKELASSIRNLRAEQSPLLLLSLLGLTFSYGMVHALGPGHGKSILASWIVAKPRSWRQVLYASSLAAIGHALSATLLVGATYLIVGRFISMNSQRVLFYFQSFAALLVIGLGLFLLLRLLREVTGRTVSQPTTSSSSEKTAWVALSVGLVPCPATTIIFIFCLTLGLVWQSFLLVASFAIGMVCTVVAASFAVWSVKEKSIHPLLSRFGRYSLRAFTAIGGLLLLFLGSSILFSLW